jgi:hypothetical protein
MKKPLTILTLILSSIFSLTLMITSSGCFLDKKTDDPIQKMLPLLLAGSPGASCPNYSQDLVVGDPGNYLPSYTGVYRVQILHPGTVTADHGASSVTLYDSGCTIISEVSTNNWSVTPGTYYFKLTDKYGGSFNLSMTSARPSGCADGQYGVRFTNNAYLNISYTLRLWDGASCSGSGWSVAGANDLAHGSTSAWTCRSPETKSPGADPTPASYDICADSVSSFEAGYDYTIELKSDESWERTIDY